ncbi:MAG: amidohydrolase family protein [Vicinamibacterales bacterium]
MRHVLTVVMAGVVSAALAAQTPAKWNVADPFGPTERVAFDTSEGTWMNVDVSPDGRQIVFDLLGDIYTMPVAGGTATRILGGPAFEMQPRFSPDGTRIAFASDRDGLWNIWTTKLDGSDPMQLSRERGWFVNSPTWAPDGRAVFARRHFVGARSLGAGEIWMYHAAGGTSGLQITVRQNAQKDTGEPAVSPDGRYVYFSKDITPGSQFEYNKDPNGAIFQILRHDLETGEEEAVVTRPGGSVTPRPSPDGKYLAFIRRVRLQSVLFLRDMASGDEFPIFDRLDKDLQEAWTVQGVYPQYAWTPDSASIVIWGEGKIWKVDVAERRGVEVPFTAHVDLTITPAVRFPVPVYEAQFGVRQLRDAQVSPDGTTVAWSALGRLYTRRLSGGDAARLTTSPADLADEAMELDPAWSPDGRRIAYTTWHDERLGRVMVYDVASRASRELVTVPGHYIEPAWSPDGRWIAYRRAGSDGVRADEGTLDTGLYIVAADGSTPPRRVREGGTDPEFDPTGTRLYFREQRAQYVLASVDLEGHDERVHLQSTNATDIVPSPDGKWVAFQERWHLYVMPFPRTGRPVDLSAQTAGEPVARISRDAGFFLHWSHDSRAVHWMFGPEFFTRRLDRTFTFLNAGLTEPDAPEATGVNLGVTVASDHPEGIVALVGARVITMADGAAPIENGTVLVEGNRITAVGPSNRVVVPAGARRIDVRGKTIIPGLIDAHAHVGAEGDGIPARQSWPLLANLAFGVTTMHDPSNDLEMVFANAEMIRAGLKLGPRLFSTGLILYGAETPFKAPVDTYEDALSHLRRLKAVGASSAKSYNQQRRDSRQMILKAARELHMNVVPEGGSLYYMNATHIMDGHTTVEHNLPVPVLYHDIITTYARSGVAYTPTLIVAYGALSGEYYWYQHTNVWENERLLTFTPRDVVDPRSRRRLMAADDDYGHVLVSRSVKKLSDAGVMVNMGAHGQLQGMGAHWELWMLAQGGMTPMEVLRAGTINPARSLGYDKEIGSLEVGKLADLVVLDANPLEEIRNTQTVFRVMLNGRLYDTSLNEVGSGKTRARLWFEGR